MLVYSIFSGPIFVLKSACVNEMHCKGQDMASGGRLGHINDKDACGDMNTRCLSNSQ